MPHFQKVWVRKLPLGGVQDKNCDVGLECFIFKGD